MLRGRHANDAIRIVMYWIIAVLEVNAVDCLVGQRLTFQRGSDPDYGVKWFVPHSSSGNC